MTIQTMFNNFSTLNPASSPDKGRMAGFYLQKALKAGLKTAFSTPSEKLNVINKGLNLTATTKNT